ncbi:MAG: hypothetical protein QXJ81_04950 [Metallosphaera sp.]
MIKQTEVAGTIVGPGTTFERFDGKRKFFYDIYVEAKRRGFTWKAINTALDIAKECKVSKRNKQQVIEYVLYEAARQNGMVEYILKNRPPVRFKVKPVDIVPKMIVYVADKIGRPDLAYPAMLLYKKFGVQFSAMTTACIYIYIAGKGEVTLDQLRGFTRLVNVLPRMYRKGFRITMKCSSCGRILYEYSPEKFAGIPPFRCCGETKIIVRKSSTQAQDP